ncbi:MAG: B12-binding domain-containing radical SAM protein [Victivallales bacterium]
MIRKKITFLEVNSSYSHTMLSYGYLRSCTEKMISGWKWSHIETTTNELEDASVLKLLAEKPGAVCATIYLFNHEFTLRILKKFKALQPSCMIFLGGPEFLGDNEQFLRRNPEISAVVRGDESSFHKLLSCFRNPSQWRTVPGACFIYKDRYNDGGFAKFAGNLDEIPSPYENGYFTLGRPFYQIETSRGCTGRCSFCTSALSNGTSHFGMERIKSDLETMHKLGIREIRLVDRTFNEDKARSFELLSLLRQYSGTRFHLEINPALVDEELLGELRLFKDKCLHIEAGIQSLCAKSLKAVKRLGSPGKMITGLRKLCELENADMHTDLIAGLPNQKYSDVLKDVTELVTLNPHEIQLENLKILPGTPISSNPPKGLVWNPLPPYEVLKTAHMGLEDLVKTRNLSRMLDSFLNIPRLKNIFLFGFKRDKNFIEKFLSYVEQNSDPGQKQHLDRRLLLLKDYGDKNDKLFSELSVFSWAACGFSADKFNMETEKIKPGSDAPPVDTVIYASNETIVPSRIIHASFSFNAGDAWIAPGARIEMKKHSYRFFTAHGNRVLRITWSMPVSLKPAQGVSIENAIPL